MKKLRRLVLVFSLCLILFSLFLLLNITDPNPTGRRYSSETPIMTGPIHEIGNDGERVLGKDLGLPNNNRPGQRQCVCGMQFQETNPSPCNICIVHHESINNFRIPDFVGQGFIAESKNADTLLNTSRDFEQIKELSIGASALNIPLWLYVRTNTNVPDDYHQMVADTGGGIVFYFPAEGYVDAVDMLAYQLVLFAITLILVTIVVSWVTNRIRLPQWSLPTRHRSRPKTPLDKADDSINDAQDYMTDSISRAKDYLDEDE